MLEWLRRLGRGFEVRDETTDHGGELRDLSWLPVDERVGHDLVPRGRQLAQVCLARRRELEQHGAAVVGVGGARQQTSLLERGHLPADGRHVDAQQVGQVGQANRLVLAHASQYPVARPVDGKAGSLVNRLLEPEVAGQTEEGVQRALDRLEVIVRFLALLELFKQGFVELEQAERFGDIDIVWVGDDESVSVGSLPIDDYEG